jgi:hypothetical protein
MEHDIVFEKTAFNVLHWAQFSKTDFIQEGLDGGFFPEYGQQERLQILEIIYQLVYDAARITTPNAGV